MLCVFGATLGFSANQLRESGHIRPLKNYFDKTPQHPVPGVAAPTTASPVSTKGSDDSNAGPSAVTDAAHPDHPYQEISFEAVAALFDDPVQLDQVVFIDARREDVYAQGHIPGAIRCYPYEAERSMEKVMADLEGADKVIVYCGGGDCEDSIFLCRELIDQFEVPYSRVFLYAGGWKEWTKNNMPVE